MSDTAMVAILAIFALTIIVLFGAIGDPKYDDLPIIERPEQGLLKLRKSLGLYANIRPIKTFQPLIHRSPIKEKVIANTDFIIFIELTGGIYYGEKNVGKRIIQNSVCQSSFVLLPDKTQNCLHFPILP